MRGNHDSMLVRLNATLVGRSQHAGWPVLTLQAGAQTFDAEVWSSEAGGIVENLREGSRLALTGICTIQSDETRVPPGFRLLLRSPADIVVVRAPSWWTPSAAIRRVGGRGTADCGIAGLGHGVAAPRGKADRDHSDDARIDRRWDSGGGLYAGRSWPTTGSTSR